MKILSSFTHLLWLSFFWKTQKKILQCKKDFYVVVNKDYWSMQGLNWDLLCGGGGALWYWAYINIYIYIYIYIHTHLYPKRLTNEDNGKIYVLCVCVFCFFTNMIYSNAIFYLFIIFIFYPRAFFFLYRGHFPTNLINFHFKFLHFIYKFIYINFIIMWLLLSIYVIKLNHLHWKIQLH